MLRRGPSPRLCLVLALTLVPPVLAGCDSDSYAPPPPVGLKTASSSSATAMPVRAKEVVLILPVEENADLRTYENVSRVEAGNLHVIHRAFRPRANDPASNQAALISQAVADGASALLVVPDDSKETADALAAAGRKGVPIILIGRPLASPPDGPPYTLVTLPDYAASARKLVEILVEDTRKAGLPADAPFLLVKSVWKDETTAARTAAVAAALKAAGVTVAATVEVVEASDESRRRFDAALKAHPDIRAVFADDDQGFTIGTAARDETNPRGKYMVAGYVFSRNNVMLVATNQVSAMVERGVEPLARRATRIAVDRIEGRPVPDRVEVEMNLRRATDPINPPSFR